MDADEYLASRLEVEIKWYDKKSHKNKTWNTFCKITEIGCSAVIPFLRGIPKRLVTNMSQSQLGFWG